MRSCNVNSKRSALQWTVMFFTVLAVALAFKVAVYILYFVTWAVFSSFKVTDELQITGLPTLKKKIWNLTLKCGDSWRIGYHFCYFSLVLRVQVYLCYNIPGYNRMVTRRAVTVRVRCRVLIMRLQVLNIESCAPLGKILRVGRSAVTLTNCDNSAEVLLLKFFNPLSPKSDQRQISPCNINAL